jgi:hypothetical protein
MGLYEKIIFVLVVDIVLAITFVLVMNFIPGSKEEALVISDFKECQAAQNPIAESYPRQCRMPDGTIFIEEI